MKIYHYTTIDNLALILKNRTIRFNRLDNGLDDLQEGSISSNGVKLGNYGFVSCWTENKEENIPLWKLYTDNGVGVRIALEKDIGLLFTETLIECAIRETKEETGIELQEQDIVFKKLFDDPSIIIEYPDGNIIRSMMAVYQTELKKTPLLQCSEESKELKFFTPDELKTINVVETHIPILEEFFPEVVTHVDTVSFRKQ